MFKPVIAITALLRLAMLLLPLWLSNKLAFRAQAQGSSTCGGAIRYGDGTYAVEVELMPHDQREEYATFLHECYHIAQMLTGKVAPIAVPVPLPSVRHTVIAQLVRECYPPERQAKELAAEVWARSVLLATWPKP